MLPSPLFVQRQTCLRLPSWLVALPWLLLMPLTLGSGCSNQPKADAQPQKAGAANAPVAVDVAVARTGSLQKELEYTGTTQPVREVLLRSQIEGQLMQLNVDVGDRISQGQVLAQVDDAVLVAAVVQAEAELAARESEVARAQAEVSDLLAQVKQAELRLQQARADANRLQQLLRDGAVTAQTAEQAQTQVGTAEQAVRSAQEQVRTREKAVVAAERRVIAQQAVVDQARKRRSFAVLTAPIDGSVLQRSSEIGNLVQPGGTVLRLGDFSQVKVMVQVSELELATIQPGQTVAVRLDALPNQKLRGTVSRISPAADPTARLVPVEITLPNPANQVGSGLLARVNFTRKAGARVLVPQTALQEKDRQGGNQAASSRSGEASLFILDATAKPPKVASRKVQTGERLDGQVEVLAGLQPGERFVVRSGQPLKDGDPVRLSLLSDK